jgi:hypothetical protein
MPEFYRRSRLCREGMGSARCSRDRESLSEARWRAGCRVPRAQGLVCGHQVSPPRRPYDRSASASPLKLTTHIFGQNSVPKFVKKGDASHQQILDSHRQFFRTRTPVAWWTAAVIAAGDRGLRREAQQLDNVLLAFERPRVGTYKAMIDRHSADQCELVFADTDVAEFLRQAKLLHQPSESRAGIAVGGA